MSVKHGTLEIDMRDQTKVKSGMCEGAKQFLKRNWPLIAVLVKLAISSGDVGSDWWTGAQFFFLETFLSHIVVREVNILFALAQLVTNNIYKI